MSPNDAVQIFGVRLVGVTPENGRKLLFTIIFVLAVLIASHILRGLNAVIFRGSDKIERAQFWIRQAIKLLTTAVMLLGVLSIWFNDPNRLATALGPVLGGARVRPSARNHCDRRLFRVVARPQFHCWRSQHDGRRPRRRDRARPRADHDHGDGPAARRTGRRAFHVGAGAPVYRTHRHHHQRQNLRRTGLQYSREFPYLWDEMQVPIAYNSDRRKAEEILLDVARKHTVKIEELSDAALKEMERRYFIKRAELHPRVFWRLTDNWIELSLRFIAHDSGVRDLKDKMSREIIERFDQAKIGIASGAYEVVGFPPIRIESWPNAPDDQRRAERTQHSGADGPGA